MADNTPFFSIIIPTYNRAALIDKTLISALNQSYPNFEIIVVDDGSTDNTEEVVNKFSDPKLKYYKKENAERGAARNYGMDKATGRYVTFLDSDDYYYPWYLSHAYDSINRFNFPEFFHLAYEIKNNSNKIKVHINNLHNDNVMIFVKGNPLSCIGVFMVHSITKEYRFNENRDLSGSEDWELWIRIAAKYGIKTDNRISASIIEHKDRSVLSFDEQKLLKRKLLSLQYAFQDANVLRVFKDYFKQIESYCDSYIALHLVLSGKTKSGFKYIFQASKNNYQVLFSRRFLAIVKHSIYNIFR
jgi:glycosyltransferase involved in cell wall biosynthesis